MDEAGARQHLISACHRLLAEWQAGHDWRWYGREGRWFDLSDLDFEFDKGWTDYASLSVAWSYLDAFVDSMNHGFSKFDSLIWEDAISGLEDMTARLEASRPVEDARKVAFSQKTHSGCGPLAFLTRLLRTD